MNLKGIGLWSVRKEHFSIFTCVFAGECQSHVREKSWDKIYVTGLSRLFFPSKQSIAVSTLFVQVNVRCCSRVYLDDLV